MEIEAIKTLIKQSFADCEFSVEGDGRHFQVIVVSDSFSGKTTVQQHQMVYQSLGKLVGDDIHALSISTYTNEAWQRRKKLHGVRQVTS